jgi:hypothetical protein
VQWDSQLIKETSPVYALSKPRFSGTGDLIMQGLPLAIGMHTGIPENFQFNTLSHRMVSTLSYLG